MSHFVDDQVGEIFGALRLPASWRQQIAELATRGQGVDLPKLREKRRRLARAFAETDAYSELEYRRKLDQIEAQIQVAQPATEPSLEEAVALLSDLDQLWTEATYAERQKLIRSLIERAYVDLESKRVCAIVPAPALRLLLERAIETTSRSDVLLISNDEAERLHVCSWWRRGRVELPVQRRAKLRYYRRVRRFVLVRRAVAGPASPDRADEPLAARIGVRPPHPD